ncbi:unnamed protein product [Brassica oleracea]
MKSAVAINARILTSIIKSFIIYFFFFFLWNISGFNPIEMRNLSLVNSLR